MRVLVTGGAGFVGTNLIRRLVDEGHDVVSIDNYSTGKKENEQKGCIYYNLDISDKPIESVVGKQDLVFHLAARARILPSIQNPATLSIPQLQWFPIDSQPPPFIALHPKSCLQIHETSN